MPDVRLVTAPCATECSTLAWPVAPPSTRWPSWCPARTASSGPGAAPPGTCPPTSSGQVGSLSYRDLLYMSHFIGEIFLTNLRIQSYNKVTEQCHWYISHIQYIPCWKYVKWKEEIISSLCLVSTSPACALFVSFQIHSVVQTSSNCKSFPLITINQNDWFSKMFERFNS